MHDSKSLFTRLAAGEEIPLDALMPLVYQELHQIAASLMRSERSSHTLQATALVNEAFLRLVGAPDGQPWKSRAYFFAAAATAMRRILVDYARNKGTLKRGGDFVQVQWNNPDELEDRHSSEPERLAKLLALDVALNRLRAVDEQLARLTELRTFCGLGHDAVADVLGITVYEARQKWQFARAWLKMTIEAIEDEPHSSAADPL